MGWFNGKTDCFKCGMEIETNSAEKRFGKYFCNKEEAEEFVKAENQITKASKQKSSGGCC